MYFLSVIAVHITLVILYSQRLEENTKSQKRELMSDEWEMSKLGFALMLFTQPCAPN